MKVGRLLLLSALTALFLLGWPGTAKADTLGNLMEVLEEDKHAATYDMNLNAPFTKESAGYREDISIETGELHVNRTDLVLPGRNGFDLAVQTRYESGAAKLFDENVQATWTGKTGSHSYGSAVVAYYEVFRTSDNYWLRSDWVAYAAGQTITGSFVVGAERWVFTGYLYVTSNPGDIIATDDTANITFSSAPAEKSSFLKLRYCLGEGWRFALPAVEVSTIHSGLKWLYLPDGAVYQVDPSTPPAHPSGLLGYDLTDLVFSSDTSYTNGTETSAFRLRAKDGRETFFASDGRVIGARDRFGNAIRYFYTTDTYGQKRLASVTDSVGRTATVSYVGDDVVVASGERKVTYRRAGVAGYAGKYYLTTVVDPAGREVRYDYGLAGAQFWVYGSSTKTGVNQHARLTAVTWPTRAQTRYQWVMGTKNLGAPGKMQYYRISRRADVVGGAEAYVLGYAYEKEPDGYPDYKDPSDLPATYSYATTVADAAGLSVRYQYDYRHHNTLTTYSGSGVARTVRTTYDEDTGMPASSVTAMSNERGESSEAWRTTRYDGSGDLVFESAPYKTG